tara:strand:+ start:3317 stop:3577 length:261 start_codon:yes stop_codon:yes gene_type:complete
MLKTKKMIEDIKRLNAEDIFVCKICGADDIQEKAWISVNNTEVVDGLVFHEVYDACDDMYWCSQCNTACKPITFKKYMEDENGKSK